MGDDLGKIGLIGGGFQHAFSTTLWKKPKYFEWDKGKIRDITFFIDDSIINNIDTKCRVKIAWLVESKGIVPNATKFVKDNWELISKNYDILFTHDKSIYSLSEKFFYIPSHGYWIESPKIFKKTKLVSMISSNKTFLPGHYYRLDWVNKLKSFVDLYGFGFNEIQKKEEALCDYMFSVTIENDNYPTYWSEKILDCFATGTIPIYYGCSDISNYFNENGIIFLNENFNIKDLSEDLYYSKMKYIKENFDICLNYDVIEDIIYDKWLKKYL